MAGDIIRPSALPDRPTPVATEKVPTDNGVTVGGTTWEAGVAAGRPLASQAEAEAGVNATKAMTPLTTNQAIAAQGDVRFASAAQGAFADTAVQPGRTISAGTGLTGGGDLSANRTVALNASSIASLDKADSAVQSIVAGTNVTIDNTDPQNPVINATAGAVPGKTLLKITQFTTNGTWTPDAATTLANLIGQGAGGGGGGSSGSGTGVGSASGGGGGGYQERWLSAGWGATEAVTVGVGGGGGSDTGGAGGPGTSSSVGTLCVATGGAAGAGSGTRAAADQRGPGPAADGGTGTGSGGTLAGLDVVVPGAPGQIGSSFGVGGTSMSGAGGNSALGVGGKQATEGNAGFAGRGYGAGGSGGSANSATGRAGGAGTAGIVIIAEWA